MTLIASLLMAAALQQVPTPPPSGIGLQSPDAATIIIHGRDPVSLRQQEQLITGTCDGIPSSARIQKASRRDAVGGGIELRHGSGLRALPPTFARGLLGKNTVYHAGLACDGKRLLFIARVIEMKGAAGISYFSQIATWDFETGTLDIAEPLQESAEEFAAHVR